MAARGSKSRKGGRSKQPVESLRKRIDEVDGQLHELINQRALLAREVGVSKHAEGKLVDFYRPEREAEVLRLALERNRHGTLRDEEILRLFREIMSACLAQEKPLKVAYLGPEGTFSQQAVFKHFGHSVRALSLVSIDEVFQEVQAGNADFGVVPVENSSEGTVNNTLDRFMSTSLNICGEVELRVHHNLMGRMKDLGEVQRVCAHPQALGQCRLWLDENLRNAERVPVSSNAEGARRSRDESGTAAIAADVAAEVYGLSVLARNIEDHADNTTRFLVIGPRMAAPSGVDRTSLLLAGDKDKAGSLFHLLEPFAKHKVSLSRIESRPSRKQKWDYVFFIDLEGHAQDKPVARALAELKKRSSLFRVLGSYPRAVL